MHFPDYSWILDAINQLKAKVKAKEYRRETLRGIREDSARGMEDLLKLANMRQRWLDITSEDDVLKEEEKQLEDDQSNKQLEDDQESEFSEEFKEVLVTADDVAMLERKAVSQREYEKWEKEYYKQTTVYSQKQTLNTFDRKYSPNSPLPEETKRSVHERSNERRKDKSSSYDSLSADQLMAELEDSYFKASRSDENQQKDRDLEKKTSSMFPFLSQTCFALSNNKN